MSTSSTRLTFRLESFNIRTTIKILFISTMRKMQTIKELFEIVKGLAKTFQQTSRRILLKICFTADLKRDTIIAFKTKSVS